MTPLEQACLERIRFLENYAFDTYDLQLTCGVEQEFYLRDQRNRPLRDGRVDNFELDTIKHCDAKNRLRTRWIKPDGLGKEGGIQKYEYVVQTPYLDDNENFDPGHWKAAKPSTIAIATDGAQKTAKSYIRTHYDAEMSLRPVNPRKSTSGLHVNISGWKDGRPWKSRAFSPIARHALPMLETLFPLLVESKESLQRYAYARDDAPYVSDSFDRGNSLTNRCAIRVRTDRLEFRIPGANTNPYLAVLVATAAVVDGLDRAHAKQPFPKERHHIPATFQEYRDSVKTFAASADASRILGDDLHSALKQCSRYGVGISKKAISASPAIG